ncbi:hypothetical protein A0J61_06396 [Choanephora cucurbitarum]|uniref:Uncharacterized protein n=1 Tax=Choanephora cucurbitarum TaxID=101091 RepID=A0A1C7NA48_9FUNG|nr:hypothetical protein A0J61_06396 [Choanephora cucurbitarum]
MSNEESSWPILDPLLKKPELYKDKAGLKQKSLLNYPMPLPDDQVGEELTNNNSNTAEETSNEKKSAADDLIKEIEDELEFYRYDIYTEKLKALEKELASIEEGTHKDVVASDKKALGKVKSDMSQAEEQYLLYIETIERNFETQKAEIMKDHQKELDLVNRAVNFKRHSYLDQQNNRKRTRQQIEAERREVNGIYN